MQGADGTQSIPSNPFSSRNVRPGAVPFIFRPGESAEKLVDQLAADQWCGQIIGPHGSGKSTLLAELMPQLAARGRKVSLCELHDGERRLPTSAPALSRLTSGDQLVIDGYEQLGWWARLNIRSRAWRNGFGLLVTAHQDVGLPTLYATAVDREIAHRVLAHLLPGGAASITAEDLDFRLAAQQGNLREALFDLYDLYEERKPRG
jgi:hypothetical protein